MVGNSLSRDLLKPLHPVRVCGSAALNSSLTVIFPADEILCFVLYLEFHLTAVPPPFICFPKQGEAALHKTVGVDLSSPYQFSS